MNKPSKHELAMAFRRGQKDMANRFIELYSTPHGDKCKQCQDFINHFEANLISRIEKITYEPNE